MSDPARDPSFKTAMIGVALVAPTIYFMILGGPLLAFLLNLLQVVQLSARTEPGSLTASVTVLRKPWNLASAGLILLVLLALSAYLVAENWRCWVGLLPRC